MVDSVTVSAGGRVARIYMHSERQRKITSMMNGIEAKRLEVIKRQIEDDKTTEKNMWDRKANKILHSNDDIKAFQKALLRRITVVKEKSRLSGGVRPLVNLGRYGGATIDQIKAEAEKYKPIRNPEQRRMIKTRILLEQGRRNGQIKTFKSEVLGDVTESILRLEKVAKPAQPMRGYLEDVANLDDVKDADEGTPSRESSAKHTDGKIIVRRRRLVLPPLQVARSMHPNSNYYRQISAQYKELRSSLNKDHPSSLSDIPEEYIKAEFISRKNAKVHARDDGDKVPTMAEEPAQRSEKSAARERQHAGSRRKYYEWDYSKPLGPVTAGKYLSEGQKFWRPNESVAVRHVQRIVLPKIA